MSVIKMGHLLDLFLNESCAVVLLPGNLATSGWVCGATRRQVSTARPKLASKAGQTDMA